LLPLPWFKFLSLSLVLMSSVILSDALDWAIILKQENLPTRSPSFIVFSWRQRLPVTQTYLSRDAKRSVQETRLKLLYFLFGHSSGWESAVGIVTRAWAGRRGIRIQIAQTNSGAHQALHSMGTRSSFPGVTVAEGVRLTTHTHPVPKFRMSGATPPLLYVFMACTGTTFNFMMSH
jgi:hypothetical protein